MNEATITQNTAASRTRSWEERSRLALVWRAFSRDRAAVTALVVLALVLLAAIFAPLLTPYSPTEGNQLLRLRGVGTGGHPLGLDGQGRDMLSRLLFGARISLVVSTLPVVLASLIALVLGLFAGFYQGPVSNAVMRALDVLFAFPLVLLAIAIAAVLGPGMTNVMLAVGVTLIPYIARVVYTATVQERNKEYVEAARAAGATDRQILFGQLMPNVLSPLIVYATTLMGLMIVLASGLSFLGVGIQPPAPDWGIMTADGRDTLLHGSAHIATLPGLAILIVALAFNTIGDGLRDALDPHKQTS